MRRINMKTIKVKIENPAYNDYVQEADVPVEELRRVIKENPEILPGATEYLQLMEDTGFNALYKALEPKVSAKNWRAKKSEEYWFITGSGDVTHQVINNSDKCTRREDWNYNSLNYFSSKKQAEAYKEYQLAIGTVSRAIWDANGETEDGYWVAIYCDLKEGFIPSLGCSNINWFILLPRIKDEETANQIIKDYKQELEII